MPSLTPLTSVLSHPTGRNYSFVAITFELLKVLFHSLDCSGNLILHITALSLPPDWTLTRKIIINRKIFH